MQFTIPTVIGVVFTPNFTPTSCYHNVLTFFSLLYSKVISERLIHAGQPVECCAVGDGYVP